MGGCRKCNLASLFRIDTYYEILSDENPAKGFLRPVLRFFAVLIISIKRFYNNAGSISASGLTMFSLLALVPSIALILGIANGFGMKTIIENEIKQRLFSSPEVAEWVLNFAVKTLDNAKGGVIAGVGIVILLWAVINMMGTLELVMNRIWGVYKGRSLARKFLDYLSVFFIVPVLLILIAGSNVFITTNIGVWSGENSVMAVISDALGVFMEFLPYILVWLLFIFLYMFMPKTKVRFRYAFVAGILAGTIFQLVQWFYIRFQIGVSSYNAMYGSLAALPLLIVWMKVSWMIAIWGVEFCYVLKNSNFLGADKNRYGSRFSDRLELAIAILRLMAEKYKKGEGALSLDEISGKLKIGTGSILFVIEVLQSRNFIRAVNDDGESAMYLPAVDLHCLTVADVISGLADMDGEVSLEYMTGWRSRLSQSINSTFGKDTFL